MGFILGTDLNWFRLGGFGMPLRAFFSFIVLFLFVLADPFVSFAESEVSAPVPELLLRRSEQDLLMTPNELRELWRIVPSSSEPELRVRLGHTAERLRSELASLRVQRSSYLSGASLDAERGAIQRELEHTWRQALDLYRWSYLLVAKAKNQNLLRDMTFLGVGMGSLVAMGAFLIDLQWHLHWGAPQTLAFGTVVGSAAAGVIGMQDLVRQAGGYTPKTPGMDILQAILGPELALWSEASGSGRHILEQSCQALMTAKTTIHDLSARSVDPWQPMLGFNTPKSE